VEVGVGLGAPIGVFVGVGVAVGVSEGVPVEVGVGVDVLVGVDVKVPMAVGVGVPSKSTPNAVSTWILGISVTTAPERRSSMSTPVSCKAVST